MSTNNCYYHAGRGVSFIKPKAKALKEEYKWQAIKQRKSEMLESELQIEIDIFFGTKRKSDWDNFHKLSMDALTGIIWKDDSQIIKSTVTKNYDKENPRIEIEVKTA